ncbi:hypothetical protein ACEP26_31565, partial [Pseudomonas aeruginosa]
AGTLWLLSVHSGGMEGVYLLAPPIHRNLNHFISGTGSLGDLEELGHAVDRAGLALVFESLNVVVY